MNNKDFEKAFGNFSLSDFMQECKEDFENAIPTGLYFESGQELKLQRGNITLISSKSGDGQTSVITTMAINDAIRNRDEHTGDTTIFITQEENDAGEVSIMLNNYVGVPYEGYTSGRICEFTSAYFRKENNFFEGVLPNGKTYRENFDEKSEEFFAMISKGGTLRIIEGYDLQIGKLARELDFLMSKLKISCIFIDNLDMRYTGRYTGELSELRGALEKIAESAKRHNVAIIFAHHLQRNGKLFDEHELIYDTCIRVQLLDDKKVLFAEVLGGGCCGITQGSTAYWQWIGQCKKIVSNAQTL